MQVGFRVGKILKEFGVGKQILRSRSQSRNRENIWRSRESESGVGVGIRSRKSGTLFFEESRVGVGEKNFFEGSEVGAGSRSWESESGIGVGSRSRSRETWFLRSGESESGVGVGSRSQDSESGDRVGILCQAGVRVVDIIEPIPQTCLNTLMASHVTLELHFPKYGLFCDFFTSDTYLNQGCQIWPKIGQIRTNGANMGLFKIRFLKTDLKSPRFVPFCANMAQLESKSIKPGINTHCLDELNCIDTSS